MTLSITTLSITTISIMTLSITTLSITTLSIMALSITTLRLSTLGMKTFYIIGQTETFNRTFEIHDTVFKLSVVLQSVFILNVVAPYIFF